MLAKLVSGAVGAVGAAAGAVRHLAWYLSYQAGGTARDADEPPRDQAR